KASATGARTGGISEAGGFAGFRLFARLGLFEGGARLGLLAGLARPARFGLARFFDFTTSSPSQSVG
ncbi:MAG TPA: hypothetical protein VLA79_07295, partial [Polyangia bacterium]|nr:hypothetical protein [Polyangia bacterium]